MNSTLRRLARRFGFEVSRANATSSAALRTRLLFTAHGVDLVFDVGAHHGLYGRWLRELGYHGVIVSIEPQPAAHRRLSATAHGDRRWIVLPPLALGERDGEVTLNLSHISESSSLLPMLPVHLEAAPESAYVATCQVTLRRLDSLAPGLLAGCHAPFLKLDVQGYEAQALAGAANSLPQFCGLQLELSLEPLYAGESVLCTMIEQIEALGFTLCSLTPGFTDPRNGRMLQVDAIFFRKGDACASAR